MASNKPRQECINDIVGLLMHFTWGGRKQFVDHLADHGLTVPQFYTLAFLLGRQSDGSRLGGCPIHEVAEALHKERATMTGIIDRLERAGLLERQRSQVDRRKWLVMATSQGQLVLTHAGQSWHGQISQAFAGLSGDELKQLERLLRRLVEAMTPAELSQLPPHFFVEMLDEQTARVGDS